MKTLTVQECAERIGKSTSFISKKCEKGEIPYKIGAKRARLIKETDLLAFQSEYEQSVREGGFARVAPTRDTRPRCQHCEIILEMAPEGYSGKLCNLCVETAVSEEQEP